MNWFIYIGGWILGWAFFNTVVNNGDIKNEDLAALVKLVAWTFIWVWIWWRFI